MGDNPKANYCPDPAQDRAGSALPLRFTRIRSNSASKIPDEAYLTGWDGGRPVTMQFLGGLSSKAVRQACLHTTMTEEKRQGSEAGGLCVPLTVAGTPNVRIGFWNKKSTLLIIWGHNCPPFNPEALASAENLMKVWAPTLPPPIQRYQPWELPFSYFWEIPPLTY